MNTQSGAVAPCRDNNGLDLFVGQVNGVLDKYEKEYSEKGVLSNLNAWRENKGELIDLLRQHPDWCESAMAIVSKIVQTREIESDIVRQCKNDIFFLCHELEIESDVRATIYNMLDAVLRPCTKLLPDEEMAMYIKRKCDINCCAGQKTSRVVNAICKSFGLDKHPSYNSKFAKLSDSLSPMQVKRIAMLSVHPCDFLEMSNRDNSWTSCHTLNDGEYSAGTLSYMNDECSMIFYTIDEDVADEFYKAPKRTRQVFCYKGGILLQSRLYPQTDDTQTSKKYRNIVQSVLAQCLAEKNQWALFRGQTTVDACVKDHSAALHYPDYSRIEHKPTVSLLSSDRKEIGERTILIGSKSYCLSCSEQNDKNNRLLCGGCCGDYETCYKCDCRVDENEYEYIGDNCYCYDCCHECNHCGYYVSEETIEAINRYGDLVSVCPYCIEESYICCHGCDKFHHEVYGMSIYQVFYCNSCIKNKFYTCKKCDSPVRRDQAKKIEGDYFCQECSEPKTKKKNPKKLQTSAQSMGAA